MDIMAEVDQGIERAKRYVLDGGRKILTGKLDEHHGVSASPGATALASMAMLALGRGFEQAHRRGVNWLWRHRQPDGWGKYPGDKGDEEITKVASTVLQGSRGGIFGKLSLLAQARKFSQMVLCLGERMVPGLEGPTPEEIKLPRILDEDVLVKLPQYGRPVVVAAGLLAAENGQDGVSRGVEYLWSTQGKSGAWAEDIVATSMAILALMRHQRNTMERIQKAGHWLVSKQYADGGWPAFDQLQTWAMGWMAGVLTETEILREEEGFFKDLGEWLEKAQHQDGSFGSTPPYAHPDLDDTAVALIGLNSLGKENDKCVQLLKRTQNEDGSWGTFPLFKGTPPDIVCEKQAYIDSADVSIHVLEALWRATGGNDRSISRGLSWLLAQQTEAGDVPSIWFERSIYSTAQLLELLGKWSFNWEQWRYARQIIRTRKKNQDFLLANQNEDGSWGLSTVETALSLAALLRHSKAEDRDSLEKGVKSLLAQQKEDGSFLPAYQGVYAKGWNYEEPISTALTAIRALNRYKLVYGSRG